MKRLGLTGGIASGKTTVAAILRELGFPVLDADRLAHRVINLGSPAYREVLKQFGSEILAPDGQVDRSKLGAIVFADRAKLDKLNAIVHPRVEKAIVEQFDMWEAEKRYAVAFVEAALIVEAGIHKKLDGLVVAWCTPVQQLARLQSRGLTEAEARKRIASQMPIEEKLRYATERIDCSGSLENTRAQVEALAAGLHGERKYLA